MNFRPCLLEQIKLHPSIMPRDVVKLCYQSAFGAEHLLSDLVAAEEYLKREIASVEKSGDSLFEFVSDDICRINLSAWKEKKLPIDWLFNMFVMTASASGDDNGDVIFRQNIDEVNSMAQSAELPFSADEWRNFYEDYEKGGVRAIHHSDQYRASENPSYRIVLSKFVRLSPLLELIAGRMASAATNFTVPASAETVPSVVVSLDGRAASGKTTLAAQLAQISGAGIVHMDDFFLPIDLRNEARFAEIGGNVHYERFLKEVMPHIRSESAFSYQIFDCGEMDFRGRRNVEKSLIRIVEGAYASHPKFGDYFDIRVFSDVTADEQMKRIINRDGEEMAEMFKSRWLPFEEQYIEAYAVMQNADLVI